MRETEEVEINNIGIRLDPETASGGVAVDRAFVFGEGGANGVMSDYRSLDPIWGCYHRGGGGCSFRPEFELYIYNVGLGGASPIEDHREESLHFWERRRGIGTPQITCNSRSLRGLCALP